MPLNSLPYLTRLVAETGLGTRPLAIGLELAHRSPGGYKTLTIPAEGNWEGLLLRRVSEV